MKILMLWVKKIIVDAGPFVGLCSFFMFSCITTLDFVLLPITEASRIVYVNSVYSMFCRVVSLAPIATGSDILVCSCTDCPFQFLMCHILDALLKTSLFAISCVTRLLTWQKRQLWRVDRKSRTGLIYFFYIIPSEIIFFNTMWHEHVTSAYWETSTFYMCTKCMSWKHICDSFIHLSGLCIYSSGTFQNIYGVILLR